VMSRDNSANETDILAAYLRGAGRIACLTGAGMSTESGIPDYRSPQGLYRTLTSEDVFDIRQFRANPEKFYRVIGPLYTAIEDAAPNAGHRALAELACRCGKKVTIATQNIDGLHQKAGSQDVHEVHGTMRTLTCLSCGTRVGSSGFRTALQAGEVLRHQCGGILKPDITFFGEMLPEIAFMAAQASILEADLVLILGTSLCVYPAAALPSLRRSGSGLVIINRDETSLDGQAGLVIHGAIGDVLPRAVQRLPCSHGGGES